MFQLGDDFAAFLAAVELKVDLPLYVAAFGTLAAQLFQTAHAAFVTGTARFDAFAYPRFFLRVEFVEEAVVFRLNCQLLRFFLAVFGERAGIRAQNAAVKFDDARSNIVQKTAVVGNHNQAAFKRLEQVFQPDNRVDVQMVGRFVQQQYIGLLHPSLRQGDTLFLTAGEVANFFVFRQTEFPQSLLDCRIQFPTVLRFDFKLQFVEFFQQSLTRTIFQLMANMMITTQ